ncbi:MAG: thioredoxin reductase, partial [Bacillota bacterium]
KTNNIGEVIVDNNQMTSLPGLYAAGDITEQPFKQIIIATAEGAKAALAINQYINQNYKGE